MATVADCHLSDWYRQSSSPFLDGNYPHTPRVRTGDWFVSTTGSDSNSGMTSDTAFLTFAHAESAAETGDTILVVNGTYSEALEPTKSSITWMAQTIGGVTIQKTSDGAAIDIYSDTGTTYSYITVDGFIARSMGEYAAIRLNSQDNIVEASMTNNITLRNCGAFGSANLTNTMTIGVSRVRDSLMEDCFSYGFGRKSIQIYGSHRITSRRIVARYDYWDGGGYKPGDPRHSFAIYNSLDCISEDIILLDAAPDPVGRVSATRSAVAIEGNTGDTTTITGASDNEFHNIITINNIGRGLYSSGWSGGNNDNNVINNFISYENQDNGFILHAYTTDTTISNLTIGEALFAGMRVNNDNVNGVAIDKTVLWNNTTYAFIMDGYDGYEGLNISVTNTSVDGNPSSSDIEAAYTPTFDYLVDPTMVSGHERGAVITKRSVNGVLTDVDLWPFPNEDLIKEHMLNSTDLIACNRVASGGAYWQPGWDAADTTLTRYIWEYLGNTIPDSVYGAS